MTKADATALLIDGSANHNAEFVTVKRELLLIALGHLPEPPDPKAPADDDHDRRTTEE